MPLLIFFNTQSCDNKKISSSLFINKAHITYDRLAESISSILYLFNYLFHIAWYTIFTPTEETLYRAIEYKQSMATHIILTYYNINPNYRTKNKYDSLPENSFLHKACENGDLQTVEKLLSFPSTDPNILNRYQWTPLYVTYNISYRSQNWFEIIKLFIQNPKTDINKQIFGTSDNENILLWTCEHGYTKIVKLLLNRSDIDLNNKLHTYDFRPYDDNNTISKYLAIAHKKGHKQILTMLCEHQSTKPLDVFIIAIKDSNIELVKKLLKTNNDIIIQNWHKSYTFEQPITENNLKIIKIFIQNPVIDINYVDKRQGISVLFWACHHGHKNIVKLLLNRPDIQINSRYENNMYHSPHQTCLQIAHNKGYVKQKLEEHKKIFNMLSEHPAIDPVELFAIAIEYGHVEIVKKLLEKHQLSTLEDQNKNSLQKTVINGNKEIFELLLQNPYIHTNHTACNAALYEAVKLNNELFVQQLLSKIPNLNIHKKSYQEQPPIFYAIENSNIPIAQLLYNHTPDIINECYDGNTPLIFASQQKNNKEIIPFLINICNADISIKHFYNTTFFHLIAMTNKTFDLEKLTFFNQYNNTQKKQFINAQLESFVHIQFPDNQEKIIDYYLENFINYCKNYSGDFNQRINKNRPVDTASEICTRLAKDISYDSQQFIIKEKIYHAFLNQTDVIPEDELHYRLKEKLGFDIKNKIMHYYYTATIDQKIASLKLSNEDYYDKETIKKIHIKEQLLNITYKKLGYVKKIST